jgi:zinc transport system substrate-binding protein
VAVGLHRSVKSRIILIMQHPLTPRSRRRRARALAVVLAAGLAAATVGCSSDEGARPGTVDVVAAFYPLAWVTEQVGGDHVTVRSLTRPGAEPHDLELRPRDVGTVVDADLVVYLGGFQPAVDDAVKQATGTRLNVAEVADEVPFAEHGDDDEAGHDHAAGTDEAGHTADDGHDHGLEDPHVWLDPQRMVAITESVRDHLVEVDATNAAAYRRNASALVASLRALDGRFATGLDTCKRRDIVTTHAAFGYLADRYHLNQLGITGLSPDAEPTAGELTRAAAFVREHDVSTIYFETLISPAVARTVASETGARTAVLDPLEGITDASAGHDYLTVMDANLAALRTGLDCT